VKLLLDTHTLLWHALSAPQVSGNAATLLADTTNSLHLSMASVWEVAIKVGLGKLTLNATYPDFVARGIRVLNLTVLPITLDDCAAYERLPFPDPQHRDPFDRMIVAHALRHGLSVVGVDAAFDAYGVPRLW